MNKSGLAGAGLGALALLLAIVNFSRVSGAISRLEEAKGPVSGGNESALANGARPSGEDRNAEIDWLKKETARISDEIRKARADIASGAFVSGTGTKPDPDGKTPLPLTAADVGAVIDSILEQRWKDQKLREADAKITMLERGAQHELESLASHMKLDPAVKARVEAVLKSQVEGYAEILRTLPVPDDKQARLDKVTAEAEAQMKLTLTADQFQQYQRTSGAWHGYNQKSDPKRDNVPQPPRK